MGDEGMGDEGMSYAGEVEEYLRRIGGLRALLSIWALTAVPAAFSVYILHTVVAERWPESGAAFAVQSLPGTLAIWLLLMVAFAAWATRRT